MDPRACSDPGKAPESKGARMGIGALAAQMACVIAWAARYWVNEPMWLPAAVTAVLFPASIVSGLIGLATDRPRAYAVASLTVAGLITMGAVHLMRTGGLWGHS